MAKASTPKIPLRATSGKKSLRFGLVSVGVSLAPALDDSSRVSARLLDPILRTPLKQQYVNERGEVVERSDSVKGYPYGSEFVVLSEDEVPKATDEDIIQLVACLPADKVPHEWIERTYLAWPTDQTQDAGYALVVEYLRDLGKVFVGTTVANGTTKAFAVRWSHVYGCLVAQLLSYHAQVRWENVKTVCLGVLAISEPEDQMIQMAVSLFDNLPTEFDWEAVQDEYGQNLSKAISDKALGAVLSPSEDVAKPAVSPDLLAALKASLSEMPVAASARKKVTA